MKDSFVLLSLYLISAFTCIAQGERYNEYNSSYDEDGYLRYDYSGKLVTGSYQNFHDNGWLHYEGSFKDGKTEGLVKEYYDNGELSSEGTFKDGKEEGVLKKYYENGQLSFEGTFKDGNAEGLLKTYYENGQLFAYVTYKDGKAEGLQKKYYENGQLLAEVTYNNDKEVGLIKWYDENGQLFAKANLDEMKEVDREALLQITSEALDKYLFSLALDKLEEEIANIPALRPIAAFPKVYDSSYKLSDAINNRFDSLQKEFNNKFRSIDKKLLIRPSIEIEKR